MTSLPRQDYRIETECPARGAPGGRPDRAAAGGTSRLNRVIAPLLREHGLAITSYPADAREPRELVITNPAFPGWGRVVIDRDGFMEWDLQATVATDDGARGVARVITGILASGEDEAGDRYGRPPHWQPPEDAARPHP